MPPTLFRRRRAPASSLEPRSSSQTIYEAIFPRSPLDEQPNLSPHTSRHEAELVASPTAVAEPNIPLDATRVQPRQAAAHTVSTIPAGYGALHSGPDPGTVVGITLGSVGGFLFLVWMIWFFVNLGQPGGADTEIGTASIGTASVVSRRRRRSRRRGHHGNRSPRRETIEVRSTRRPFIVEEGGREVLVEETTRRRSVSRARGPSAPPPPRVVREDDEDEVVVIEETTPPRRHRSRRSGSGYRDVDPALYAGGSAPVREVRRSSGGGRR